MPATESVISEPECTLSAGGRYDVSAVRKDFPALARTVRDGKPLIYLDSAARSHMPIQVINAMSRFDSINVANVHRGIHQLSDEATDAYEESRERVARFLGVSDPREIIYVRNTTEGLNLIAFAWAMHELKEGDAIVTSVMEHHSNLVPWQLLAKWKGITLKHIPVTADGKLDMEMADKLITPDVKLVTIVHLSNVLGVINPINELAGIARKVGAMFVVDGSQSAAHLPVDLSKIDCDFFALSGYKMLGPTGIGVLWGKLNLLESMEPFMSGGSMIEEVGLHSSTWAPVPQKFEAGTPNITGAVGLGIAAQYLDNLNRERALEHEKELIAYCIRRLDEIGGVDVYGDTNGRASAIAFNIRGMHPHDTASILDSEGVAVRAGHHCAQPLHAALGIDSSTRASFHCYNNEDDVERFIHAVQTAKDLFAL